MFTLYFYVWQYYCPYNYSDISNNNKVLFGLYKIGKESPSYTLTRHAPVIGQVQNQGQNQLFCSMNLISSGQLYM